MGHPLHCIDVDDTCAGAWESVSGETDAEPHLHTPPAVSIVVPTRNEAGNIALLVESLERALQDVPFEVVFVDDSDDDTVAAIEAAQEQARCTLRVIHRLVGKRQDGLAGAVVQGLRVARAPWICVMDADLQHPPELVPQMLQRARQGDVDLVIGSRYCRQGDAQEFNRLRASLSRVSTTAARVTFPHRLRTVSDPMSGFFVVRRTALDIDHLKPYGFKILLEILIQHPELRIAELGFHFGSRHAGESKASFREGMKYMRHLYRLRVSGDSVRFMRFLSVGISGLLVNMLLLALMTEWLGLHYMLSAVFATQGSTVWNFGLTEHWVFADRQQARGRVLRLVLFLFMNNAAFLLRGPMIYLLTDRLGLYYLLSNLISLVALTIVRYGVADNLIWKRSKHSGAHTSIFNYNIHGIITVQSDVRLPELEGFITSEATDLPTIRVRIGTVGRPATTSGTVRRILYDEGIGALGFGAEITLGDTVAVVASPLLRHSPHVLYTNVVEPILRWTFVEKGYALVHGACIAVDEHAYLVTARTDTGKTTTMLRMLARQRRAVDRMTFLSDDLTLVSRDGAVLTYPKPLTISHHTVRAVNATLLSWRERLVLPFQSRIHSRSGRRFAFLLTQTRLPVATINALVQWLVPPPKYHVQRLVPQVKVAREAKLAGMFIIERGDDRDVAIGGQEALEILMTNCEDAYGFPPYPTIKDFLHSRASCDLREVEREIVDKALMNHPTMLLGSSKMDWAQRISSLIHACPVENGPLFVDRGVGVLTPNLTT